MKKLNTVLQMWSRQTMAKIVGKIYSLPSAQKRGLRVVKCLGINHIKRETKGTGTVQSRNESVEPSGVSLNT